MDTGILSKSLPLFSMMFEVMGGLGIFLLGMHNMSNGLQTIAGAKLRKMIGAVTNNRFMAVLVGTLVTAILQSSSVTTVMVVGFVNSGLMTLSQSIGVILGANIGTTITGWILVLKIGKYGLPILSFASFFFLFSKKEKVRYWAMAIMGVGMVFFGLELMKNGFKPIRSYPEFEAWFHVFSAATYLGVLKCALVGCILTFIVQSSSATLGITIGLASTGVIDFNTAAALVLGENIGTTITAFLASFNTTTNARRAAYGHIIFNVLGVVWITAIFPIYIKFIRDFLVMDPNLMVMKDGAETFPYISGGIATVHTGFNVANTLLFLPFLTYFRILLEKLVPKRAGDEMPRLTNLDVRMLETPVLVIEQSKFEILKMAEISEQMLVLLKEVLANDKDDEDVIQSIFKKEEMLDVMQKEVSTFLIEILSAEIPHHAAQEAHAQIRMADEYESVSDDVVTILKLFIKLRKEDMTLSDAERNDLMAIHKKVALFLKTTSVAIRENNLRIMPEAHVESAAVTHCFKDLRSKHLTRLGETKMPPLLSVSYLNMLNSYRQIRGHTLNLAEAFTGEKD